MKLLPGGAQNNNQGNFGAMKTNAKEIEIGSFKVEGGKAEVSKKL